MLEVLPFLISALRMENYNQSHCDLPEFINRVSGRPEVRAELSPGLPLYNYLYHSASWLLNLAKYLFFLPTPAVWIPDLRSSIKGLNYNQ